MISHQLPRLCLIEDDAIMGESLCDRFELEGYSFDWYKTAASATAGLDNKQYAVVISDIRLPDQTGDDMFIQLRKQIPSLPPFIFITGFGAIDTAVSLLKQGAADYITKPFDLDSLMEKIRLLVSSAPQQRSAAGLGISPAMRRIAEMLPRLVDHATTICITGESGVGKEKVALELHRGAPESQDKPFIAVNCGAITETLLEAELFGHEKGAFTGAARTKKGVFEQADGGTLFLDEIGEMPLSMQVKLLRVIQERCITRVGGEKLIPANVRLVCATHRDLKQMVEQGTFREDLFYRINVIQLKIPPLRERKEDILWFADLFLEHYATQLNIKKKWLLPATEMVLLDYPWPGNVRELKHCIERAYILTNDQNLSLEHLFDDAVLAQHTIPTIKTDADLSHYLHECERRYIMKALDRHQHHMGNTAAALGISRKNLWEKMRKLEIAGEIKET
ncbi:sigma-54 dependent transcriptional regulator [Herbaspirillum sp. ST 5-3]|uniref:sigma-54-dependent transcriptional regulator n=1 Tax=Oxalobacteraceae TaxID=75682 RepID=UPI0010A2D01B|nr:sigma-54 dependent transcriptional regulator [Herbaspirillum sp. ST 5-3]